MGPIMTNFLTTVPGTISLLIVLWNAWQTKTLNVEDLRQALVGIGLIFAKDFNVTGIGK